MRSLVNQSQCLFLRNNRRITVDFQNCSEVRRSVGYFTPNPCRFRNILLHLCWGHGEWLKTNSAHCLDCIEPARTRILHPIETLKSSIVILSVFV